MASAWGQSGEKTTATTCMVNLFLSPVPAKQEDQAESRLTFKMAGQVTSFERLGNRSETDPKRITD